MFVIVQGLLSDDYITQGYGVAIVTPPAAGFSYGSTPSRKPKKKRREDELDKQKQANQVAIAIALIWND